MYFNSNKSSQRKDWSYAWRLTYKNMFLDILAIHHYNYVKY